MLTRTQFEQSLQNPLDFWSSRTWQEVFEMLGPEASVMVGFDQRNPYHCYDLFTHTLHTVEGVPEDLILLRVAAFFHDIGKPSVAKEKKGKLVYYGHPHRSTVISEKILEKLRYSKEEIKEICFYIEHHDDFIQWILPEEVEVGKKPGKNVITEENLRRYIKNQNQKCRENGFSPKDQNWRNLLKLCRADASAHAAVTVKDGVVVDTNEHRLQKISAMENCL